MAFANLPRNCGISIQFCMFPGSWGLRGKFTNVESNRSWTSTDFYRETLVSAFGLCSLYRIVKANVLTLRKFCFMQHCQLRQSHWDVMIMSSSPPPIDYACSGSCLLRARLTAEVSGRWMTLCRADGPLGGLQVATLGARTWDVWCLPEMFEFDCLPVQRAAQHAPTHGGARVDNSGLQLF